MYKIDRYARRHSMKENRHTFEVNCVWLVNANSGIIRILLFDIREEKRKTI